MELVQQCRKGKRLLCLRGKSLITNRERTTAACACAVHSRASVATHREGTTRRRLNNSIVSRQKENSGCLFKSIHNRVVGTKAMCDQLSEVNLSPNRRRDVCVCVCRVRMRHDPDAGRACSRGSDVKLDSNFDEFEIHTKLIIGV